MGFQRSTLKLVFEDPQFEGFEVKSRRLSIDALFTIADLRAVDWTDTKAAREAFTALTTELATVLTGWNLEDADGNPVPLTADTLGAQDYALILAISGALMEGSSGVSRPLSPPSNGGEPSVEASIPMETLSGSPTS